MNKIILCNLSDANSVVEESRLEWVSEVLESIGVDPEIINEKDVREYRFKMEEVGVEVLLYSNGEIDVFKKIWFDDGFNQGWLPTKNENLVAQWKTPERIRKIEEENMYYEIHLNEWSIKRQVI